MRRTADDLHRPAGSAAADGDPVVVTPAGAGWFMHFNSTGAFGRIVHLQPVVWRDDWPVMGEPVDGKTFGQPVLDQERPSAHLPQGHPPAQLGDQFGLLRLLLSDHIGRRPADERLVVQLGPDPGELAVEVEPLNSVAEQLLDEVDMGFNTGSMRNIYSPDQMRQHGFTRAEQDAYATESVLRARTAVASGAFAGEIVPVVLTSKGERVQLGERHALRILLIHVHFVRAERCGGVFEYLVEHLCRLNATT